MPTGTDVLGDPGASEIIAGTGYSKTLGSRWIRRSRSSKVVDFGANWKRVYDFLLVRNSLAPFRRYFRFFALPSDPTPIPPQFWGVPVAPDVTMLWSARAEALRYSAVKLFSKNSNLFDHGT